MATLTFKYMLLHILGAPIGLLAMVSAIAPEWIGDINIGELPEPAKFVFYLLGAAYIFFIVLNARENYRKKKIDNDERELELKKKHDRPVRFRGK